MPSVTPALLVASAVVTAVWLGVVLLWPDAPFALTFDDAWYYLGIARHVAAGQGSTFDGIVVPGTGTINLTNGYHPLWMLLCTIPVLLGLDDLAAGRAVLAFQVVVGLGGSLTLLSLALGRTLDGWLTPLPGRRPSGGSTKASGPAASAGTTGAVAWHRARRNGAVALAVVLALVAGNPFVVKMMVNGMESGIVITFDAALLYLAVRHRGRWLDGTSTAWRLGVGLLVAGAFLARTDGALLAACLGLWWLAEAWRPEGPTVGRAQARLGLVPLLTPVALTAVAYAVVNQRLFGTWQQVSGLVKRAELSGAVIAEAVAVAALAAALGWHTWRRAHGRKPRRDPRFPLAGRFVVDTGWFAAFCVLLTGYYLVLQTQQWPWYYAPLALYGAALLVLAVADITTVAVTDLPSGRDPARALLPVAAVAVAVLVGGLVYTTPQFADPDLRSIQVANRHAAEWMRANLPDDAVVLSWDAGALGYFSHRQVFNLDGVANSHTYYRALREGRPWPATFIDCRAPLYVANHGAEVSGIDPDIHGFVASSFGSTAAEGSRLVHEEPFVYSGVTASSSGFETGGSRPMAVQVVQVPVQPPSCANP